MSLVPTKIRREVCAYVDELVTAQNSEGAWGDKLPVLETSVITCQATHFLSSFRGKDVTKALERATEWLTRPAVASSEYSHWRYVPLLEAKASEGDLEQAISHLRDKVQLGIKHHENSPLQEYYAMCRIKHGGLDSLAKQIVNDSLKELSAPPADWSPEKLAFKLAIVVLSGMSPSEQLVETAIDRLVLASTCKGDIRHWHTLVATAYIEMNLLQLCRQFGSASAIGKKSWQIAEQTARYLVKQWDKGDFASEPLAGGVFDKTPYSKIVVARALVEVLDFQEPRWREPFLSESSIAVVPQQMTENNQERAVIKSGTGKPTNSPWASGTFYLMVIIVISALFAIIAAFTSFFVASGAVSIAIIALSAIGAFQLRNDDRLKEEPFVKLMLRTLTSPAEFFKRNKDRR